MPGKLYPDVEMTPPTEPTEIEAKLAASRRAFAAIAGADEIGGWRVVQTRTVDLRDAYWDTQDRSLGRAGCTLRVREIDGAPEGELTYKGPAAAPTGATGSSMRVELIARAAAGSTPRDWERLPAAAPILAALRRMSVDGQLQQLRPDVVLRNPRREMVLRHDGDEAVLSLDEVTIEGHPYRRRYVEIELRRGSRAALDAVAAAAAGRFGLRPARKGKVQAAREWLARYGRG
jgi:inorganic triphosphatase YgiF